MNATMQGHDARPPIRRRTAPVTRQLDEAEVANAAERLNADGVEAVAVCFLHSYRNREHEDAATRILERLLRG